ncbi:MAG: hypothetical protein RIK85_10470 [Marinobacter sp.]
MKVKNFVKPGWFYKGRQRYLALSEVPRTINLTASEATEAVSRGDLRIERVIGYKVVTIEELFNWIETREDRQ